VTDNEINPLTCKANELKKASEKTGASNTPEAETENTQMMQNIPAMQGESTNISAHSDEREKSAGNWNISMLLDVELLVRVSFGQTEMQLRDVFKLGIGSVIELDKSVNDPVAVIVNNKQIAKGEVVLVDGNYGVRILEVESTEDRIRSLE